MATDYLVDGMRYLLPQIQGKIYQIKVLCNERGALFFPVSIQHADRCSAGIIYREGSKGNALAGMIYSDHIELRRHDAFSPERVRSVIAKLMTSLAVGLDRVAVERLKGYGILYGAEDLGRIEPLCRFDDESPDADLRSTEHG